MTSDRPDLFKMAEVETRNLPDVLKANGSVTPDVNRTIHVTSLGSGRVIDLRVRLGDMRQEGTSIVANFQPRSGLGHGRLSESQADEGLSRKALERAQLLLLAWRACRKGSPTGARHRGQSQEWMCKPRNSMFACWAAIRRSPAR